MHAPPLTPPRRPIPQSAEYNGAAGNYRVRVERDRGRGLFSLRVEVVVLKRIMVPTPPAQPAPPLPHVSKKRHPFAVRGSEGAGRAGEGRGLIVNTVLAFSVFSVFRALGTFCPGFGSVFPSKSTKKSGVIVNCATINLIEGIMEETYSRLG